jgi:hypothetical protein
VITLGCNEVPKGGGGTYWCDGEGVEARSAEDIDRKAYS